MGMQYSFLAKGREAGVRMYQSDMFSQYDGPKVWKESKIIGQGC
jgi:hypothetical protein